jgi:hypothetical protein
MTIFSTALQDMFNSAIGEDATYNPAGGAAISLRVIVNRSILLQPGGLESQVYERGTTIEAQLADVGSEPNRGDTFTVGAETFTVKSIESNDNYTVVMVVT